MATGTLTSTTIAARYKSLLKLTGTANDVLAADASAKYVEDGDGNDSVFSLSTTRVGIGNTAPTALLTAGAIVTLVTDGTTAVTPEGVNVHITEASKYAMGIKNADASGDGLLIQAGDAADDFALRVEDYDSANDLLVVQGGGAVGIGTAAPAGILHTYQSNANNNIYFDTFDNGASSNNLYIRKSDHDSSVAQTDDNDTIGSIIFQGVGTAPSFQHAASITVKQNGSAEAGYVPATMRFDTGTHTSQLNLHQGGDVEVNVGSLTIATADKGISFTGGTDPDTAGSATGNILNDYEEGTWTATFTTNDVAPTTPRTVSGDYTRIGNLVTITAGSSGINMTGGVGNLRITGIPFDLATADAAYGSCYFMNFDIPDGAMNIICHIHSSDADKIRFISTHDDTSYQQIVDNTPTAGRCYFTITYHCA